MKISIQVSTFIMFAYASSLQHLTVDRNNYDYKTNMLDENTVVHTKQIEEHKIDTMKKIIILVTKEQDIYSIIPVLEVELKAYLNISAEAKAVAANLYLDSILAIEKEPDIRCIIERNELTDDFTVKLNVIINGMFEIMHRYIEFGVEDEFYRFEMINNLDFLKGLRGEYIFQYEIRIIEIIIDFARLISLKASGLADEGTTQNIKEMNIRIKRNDKELRIIISRSSASFMILNNIIQEMPCLDLLMMNSYVAYTQKQFIKNNVLDCPKISIEILNPRGITRKQPRLLFINTTAPINMWSLYKNLEKLKNKWKSGKYTDFECKFIFSLYLVEYSFQYFNVIDTFMNALVYKTDLSAMQSNKKHGLYTLLISLIPVNFIDIIQKWRRYKNTRSYFLTIDFEYLQKIIEFREHLLNINTGVSCNDLSDLEPKEGFKSVKVIIGYYQAFLGYQYKECKNITGILIYDLEAMNDICIIISYHLRNIDALAFRNDIEKYVKLCYILKRQSSKIIKCNMNIDSISLYDYPDLLEFYEEYRKIGLYIGCIYNINFILGSFAKGNMLSVYSGYPRDKRTDDFFSAAYSLIKSLGIKNYNTFTYDEDIYMCLDSMMMRLVAIKNCGK